jgi:uncharacterized surface protein with fasciclin (FAS1) repeats
MASLQSYVTTSDEYTSTLYQPKSAKRIFNGYINKILNAPLKEQKELKLGDISIYRYLRDNPHFTVFVSLIDKSQFKNLLDNPASSVTVFAPTDKAFEAIQFSVIEDINSLNIDEFVAYHICKNKITLRDMSGRRFYAQTYGRDMLLINGLSIAEPKVGKRYKNLTAYPVPNSEASVMIRASDIGVKNGVIHVVSAPLIAENY